MLQSTVNPILPDSPFAKEVGFTSDKFDGHLLWDDDGTLTISSVMSLEEHKGHFLRLLRSLTQRYRRVEVNYCSNRMYEILQKFGFKGDRNKMYYMYGR